MSTVQARKALGVQIAAARVECSRCVKIFDAALEALVGVIVVQRPQPGGADCLLQGRTLQQVLHIFVLDDALLQVILGHRSDGQRVLTGQSLRESIVNSCLASSIVPAINICLYKAGVLAFRCKTLFYSIQTLEESKASLKWNVHGLVADMTGQHRLLQLVQTLHHFSTGRRGRP